MRRTQVILKQISKKLNFKLEIPTEAAALLVLLMVLSFQVIMNSSITLRDKMILASAIASSIVAMISFWKSEEGKTV